MTSPKIAEVINIHAFADKDQDISDIRLEYSNGQKYYNEVSPRVNTITKLIEYRDEYHPAAFIQITIP